MRAPPMELTGTVSSGLGRAQIFMAQEHYQSQFKEILGQEAWPGTLNVKVSGQDLAKYVALRNCSGVDTLDIDAEIKTQSETIDVSTIKGHRIRGFLTEGRSFGGATAFPALLADGCVYRERLARLTFPGLRETTVTYVSVAILIPDLTRHVDVVEVIATEFLREALSISDGDVVILNLD